MICCFNFNEQSYLPHIGNATLSILILFFLAIVKKIIVITTNGYFLKSRWITILSESYQGL
jgi:hypothetical protein